MARNRIGILAAVIAVAAVLVFIAVRSQTPRGGAQGTIGAAQRYDAQQMGNGDVQLSDADVQAFLQSDTFHKIAVDPTFRAAVKSGDIAKLASSNAYRELMKTNSDQFVVMLTQNAFISTASNSNFQKVMNNSVYRDMIFSDNFVQLMRSNYGRAVLDQQVIAALQSHDMAKAEMLAQTNYAKVIAQSKAIDEARASYDAAHAPSADAARGLPVDAKTSDAARGLPVDAKTSDAARGLPVDQGKYTNLAHEFNKNDFEKTVDSQQFQALMGDKNFMSMVDNQSFANLMHSDQFVVFLNSPAVAQMVSSDQSRAAIQDLMSSDALMSVANMKGFSDMMQINGMRDLLSSNAFMAVAQKGSDLAKAVEEIKTNE